MARTTAASVKEIVKIRSSVPDTKALNRGITTANLLVSRIVAPNYDEDNEDADAALLVEIETYLAAHFFCIFKPRRLMEMAGKVQQTIESRVDLGLRVTRYGQQAIILDVSGALAGLADGKVAVGIKWLGTELE
jgi:hypothetical protein